MNYLHSKYLRTVALFSVVACLVQAGCASTGQSSRLTVADLDDITTEIAESLKASSFLRDRLADSPRIAIALQRLENLSSDRITRGEQLDLVEGVIDSLPIRALAIERNVVFLIDRNLLDRHSSREGIPLDTLQRHATHALIATITSVRRSSTNARTDGYTARYVIVALNTGSEVWREAFEFKRTAEGTRWD